MEHFTNILGNIFIKYKNFEQKPMDPLTDDEQIQYDNEKVCFLCEKEFCIDKKVKSTKTIVKLETIAILLVNIVVLLIVYAI